MGPLEVPICIYYMCVIQSLFCMRKIREKTRRKNIQKSKRNMIEVEQKERKLLLLLLHLPLTANPPLLIQKPTNGTTQSIIIKQNNHPRKKNESKQLLSQLKI